MTDGAAPATGALSHPEQFRLAELVGWLERRSARGRELASLIERALHLAREAAALRGILARERAKVQQLGATIARLEERLAAQEPAPTPGCPDHPAGWRFVYRPGSRTASIRRPDGAWFSVWVYPDGWDPRRLV